MRLRISVALMLLALGARASDEPALVRTLFDDARRLMSEGDYDSASKRLAEALQHSSGRGIKFQLAVCYEKLGRTASAWALFLDVADASAKAGEPDREAVAKKHAESLLARVPHLRLAVHDADITVRNDGVALAQGAWGAPLAMDPGSHMLRAEKTGFVTWEQTVVLGEGETKDIEVPALEPAPQPTAEPVVIAPTPPIVHDAPHDPKRTIALVSGGVGIATVLTGTAFAIASVATYSQSSPHCNASDVCNPEGVALRSSALTYGDIATGLLIAGSITLAASIVLFVASPKKSTTAFIAPFVVQF